MKLLCLFLFALTLGNLPLDLPAADQSESEQSQTTTPKAPVPLNYGRQSRCNRRLIGLATFVSVSVIGERELRKRGLEARGIDYFSQGLSWSHVNNSWYFGRTQFAKNSTDPKRQNWSSKHEWNAALAAVNFGNSKVRLPALHSLYESDGLQYSIYLIKPEKRVSSLTQLIRSEIDEGVRILYVDRLSELRTREATSILLDLLQNDLSSIVQASAADGLAEIADEKIKAQLVIAFKKETDPELRLHLALALARVKAKEAPQALLELLRSKFPLLHQGDLAEQNPQDEKIHYLAGKALAHLHVKEAIPDFLKMLNSNDWIEKGTAATCLAELDVKEVIPTLEQMEKPYREYMEFRGGKHRDAEDVKKALQQLGARTIDSGHDATEDAMARKKEISIMVDSLNGSGPESFEYAYKRLIQLKAHEAVPALKKNYNNYKDLKGGGIPWDAYVDANLVTIAGIEDKNSIPYFEKLYYGDIDPSQKVIVGALLAWLKVPGAKPKVLKSVFGNPLPWREDLGFSYEHHE